MNSIEITTAQKVTIEYELAGLRDRFFGYLIDCLIIYGGILFINIFFVALFDMDLLQAMAWAIFMNLGIFMIYHLVSEIAMDGQSLGKKAMGLKVVKIDGSEATLSDYLLRTVFHLADTLFTMGTLGAVLISSSNKNQRLGDIAANTAVIKIKFEYRFKLEDILRINSLDDYEPTYPDVRQFSEQDMLLIKNTITRYRKYRNKAHEKVIDELVKKLCSKLGILSKPKDKIKFLRTVVKDYIVLTR